VQMIAGLLFGIGNLALLSLVNACRDRGWLHHRPTEPLVNAGIGMWVFKVPKPGSPASRRVLVGILVAGSGGVLIGRSEVAN